MILKGTFTSSWDFGTEISTFATLDTETGLVEAEQADVDVEDLYNLDSETFTDTKGNVHQVCMDCHSHVLKEKDITDTDKDGNELPEIAGVIICSDPYCESNLISE